MKKRLSLSYSEAQALSDALRSVVEKYDRPYDHDTAEAYLDVWGQVFQLSGACGLDMAVDECQLDKMAFAVLNAGPADPERNAVLEKLRALKPIPEDALTAQELMEMHGKPVFVHGIGEWALIDIVSDSRQHDPVPWAKGLNWHYNIALRGLICARAETPS